MEWNEDEQDYYLSIVDVIEILTDQPTHNGARKYWSVMKTRLRKEGNELTTVCSQLKMKSADGKSYLTAQCKEPESVEKQNRLSAEMKKKLAPTDKL